VVRLLPPLNVTRETLDQALDVMEATFAAVRAPMTARVA
jgi:4-aminobutyrate aminotransferase-like enzyme